jgi:hypothetical protein
MKARLTIYAECVPNCVVLTVTLQVKAIFAAACKTVGLPARTQRDGCRKQP